MSYSVFARYYDELTANIDYHSSALFYDSLIKKHGGREGGLLLDLACGTGSLSAEFAALGYDVIGADISVDMLSAAMEKKLRDGLDIQYICQDMTELELYGGVNVTVCALDSLNHLPSPEDIRRTFERVYMFTEPEGLFLFDVNTPYKHKNILKDSTFVYETENLFCVWQNEYIKDSPHSRVEITLDFFRQENGVYRRSGEDFAEIAPPLGDIRSMLEDTGFEVLEICTSEGSPISETAEKAYFTAVKGK